MKAEKSAMNTFKFGSRGVNAKHDPLVDGNHNKANHLSP
jgi:hypothetical protein